LHAYVGLLLVDLSNILCKMFQLYHLNLKPSSPRPRPPFLVQQLPVQMDRQVVILKKVVVDGLN